MEGHALSGFELKRNKWPGVDLTGIALGMNAFGQIFVAENNVNGPRIVTLETLADGKDVFGVPPALGAPTSVDRALILMQSTSYNLLGENCQHYTSLSAHGKRQSSAVQAGVAIAFAVGLTYLAGRSQG